MADSKIMKYVKDTISAGYSEDEIRAALAKQGWYKEEIEEAISAVKSGQATRPQKTAKPNETRARVPATKPSQKPGPPDQAVKPRQQVRPGKPVTAFMVSLVGGILVITNALLIFIGMGDILGVIVPGFALSVLDMLNMTLSSMDSFIINIAVGGFMTAASFMMYIMPGRIRISGIFILLFSIIAVLTGNGFLIGGIMGAIGAILALPGR
jgi:hypothetical protein